MKKHQNLVPTLAALAAQIIFGFSFMFTKIALGYATPMTLIADRYIVAFVCMSVVMLVAKQKITAKKGVWKIILMSIFQPTLYFVFETFGIKLTTSSFSAIMIALIPVVSMLCGIFTLKEYPRFMQYVFSALSVAGVCIMALSGKSEGTVTAAGFFLLVGAVCSSAAFNIMSRKISAQFTVMERTYATTVIGLVSFVTIALIENIDAPLNIFVPFGSQMFVWSVLYLGVLSSVVAFLLMNYANTYLPVAKVTVFANVTTVVSVVAGVVFLDEKLNAIFFLAAIMIIVGITGVQLLNPKE